MFTKMVRAIGMVDIYEGGYTPQELAKEMHSCFEKILEVQEERNKIMKINLHYFTLYIEVGDIVSMIIATILFFIILCLIMVVIESING